MKHLKHKLIVSGIMLFLLILATGCSEDLQRYTQPLRGSDYGSYKAKKAEQDPLSDHGRLKILESQLASPLPPASEKPSYSKELADLVDSIPGVADARVFTAGKHAYISVVLDNTGQGILKDKEGKEREDARTRKEGSELRDDQRPGDTEDLEPLSKEPSIHNNPFRSFITVNDNSQLSDRFVRTVSDAVKTKQPSIKHVYLSANKDFMYYMDEFAQVIWGGESLEPYEKQFKILIDHQFFNGKEMPTSIKYYRSE